MKEKKTRKPKAPEVPTYYVPELKRTWVPRRMIDELEAERLWQRQQNREIERRE